MEISEGLKKEYFFERQLQMETDYVVFEMVRYQPKVDYGKWKLHIAKLRANSKHSAMWKINGVTKLYHSEN